MAAAFTGALLTACGQGAPASSSAAAPNPSSPAASPAASAKPQPSGSAAAGALTPPADWQQQWDSWVAGAKREGKLILASGPSQDARTAMPETFGKQFGIGVEYLGGSTSDLANRLRSEQAANQYTVDVAIAGADTAYIVLYGERLIEPVRPYLIRPDVLDPGVWRGGKVWFMDPEEQYIVRAASYASVSYYANTDIVKVEELTAWKDLLKPQYKGKIAAYDPAKSGGGGQLSAYLYNQLGADYVKALYVDQAVAVTSDYRQLSDWMARGQNPISLGMRTEDAEALKKDGFKVAPLGPWQEAPGYLSGGFGLVNLLKNPPHPNAAHLFVNWILSKEGQTAWNSSQKTVSVRTDVDNSWAPSYIVPKPGLNYFDAYSWEYSTTGWAKSNAAVKAILGG